MEFHKDPRDIDEAVDHVVYYHVTGRQPKANDERLRHCSRQAEVDDSDKSGLSSDEDGQAARVGDSPRKGKSWQHKKQRGSNASSASEKHTNTPIQQVPTQVEADQAKQIQELQEQVAKLTQRGASGGHASNDGGRQNKGQFQPNWRGPAVTPLSNVINVGSWDILLSSVLPRCPKETV